MLGKNIQCLPIDAGVCNGRYKNKIIQCAFKIITKYFREPLCYIFLIEKWLRKLFFSCHSSTKANRYNRFENITH